MRGNQESEKVESKSEKGKQTEKKEVHRCDQCKWYDVSTQRDFHRKVGSRDEQGNRTVIEEIRAVCRSLKSTARGHLVKSDSDRQCFEKGKYVPLEKPKVKKQKKAEKTNGKKANDSGNTVTLKNNVSGETQTFDIKQTGKRKRLIVAKMSA